MVYSTTATESQADMSKPTKSSLPELEAKVVLVELAYLTKEGCIAAYLFAKSVYKLVRRSGLISFHCPFFEAVCSKPC
jgi:hypothetical protein